MHEAYSFYTCTVNTRPALSRVALSDPFQGGWSREDPTISKAIPQSFDPSFRRLKGVHAGH